MLRIEGTSGGKKKLKSSSKAWVQSVLIFGLFWKHWGLHSKPAQCRVGKIGEVFMSGVMREEVFQ